MQTEWVVQNPDASGPLHIPLTVDCNTPEEKILANVLTNSRRYKRWVRTENAHNGVAVLCGSGPSLAESLGEISEIKGEVFALNGAAKFLSDHGMMADYQVIMDAQPQTIEVVGPAKQHMLASQCDPSVFAAVSDPMLWHATHGEVRVDEQEGFPEHHDDYCLIGSSISVGNTALVLLYALGYRTIHVFGMDCSHRDGKSHVAHQAINDGDPCTVVEFEGKSYVCSVTMSLQAKYFMQRKVQLEAEGCTIIVHGSGLLPDMANAPKLTESEKYQRMWDRPEYRSFSPGEHCADKFLSFIHPTDRIIDFGCGTGRAGLKFARAGFNVLLVDFADNSRDEEARHLPFIKWDLTKPFPERARFGFCTDVMEHIPTDDVVKVIRNITASADTVFFQISTVPDVMGELINQPLHLTVKPHEWWKEQFEKLGLLVTWDDRTPISSSFIVKNAPPNSRGIV